MSDVEEPVGCDACNDIADLQDITFCAECKKGVCVNCLADNNPELCEACGESDDRWARAGGGVDEYE